MNPEQFEHRAMETIRGVCQKTDVEMIVTYPETESGVLHAHVEYNLNPKLRRARAVVATALCIICALNLALIVGHYMGAVEQWKVTTGIVALMAIMPAYLFIYTRPLITEEDHHRNVLRALREAGFHFMRGGRIEWEGDQ